HRRRSGRGVHRAVGAQVHQPAPTAHGQHGAGCGALGQRRRHDGVQTRVQVGAHADARRGRRDQRRGPVDPVRGPWRAGAGGEEQRARACERCGDRGKRPHWQAPWLGWVHTGLHSSVRGICCHPSVPTPVPPSNGVRTMMRRLASVVFIAACIPVACVAADDRAGDPAGRADPGVVRPGVELFVENPPAVVRGKRVGLITNHSGMDRQGRATIDLLRAMPELELVALFSPEHGIRGTAESRVESSVDEATGLPIHSLYSDTRKPTPEMLEGIEALVYDIFDVGVRQYTYESTLALAMQAAAEKGIPFVVLDRPNPVTGTIVEGNILEPGFESFVGIYPVLSRHGMTVGELARMYNAEYGIGADLTVVPAEGWRRDMWFDETGLPWVNPSPNLRRLEAVIHYPGTVFFEAINVSEGRGSDAPFEQIGAPWLKNEEVAAQMNAL